MHLAAENGHLLCLRVLLDAGAACNVGSAEKRPQWVTTSGTHFSRHILVVWTYKADLRALSVEWL